MKYKKSYRIRSGIFTNLVGRTGEKITLPIKKGGSVIVLSWLSRSLYRARLYKSERSGKIKSRTFYTEESPNILSPDLRMRIRFRAI